VLKLFESRVNQYQKRTPPRPDLELRSVNSLAKVWGSPASKAFQPRMAQQLSNLIGFASQHAVAREDLAARTPFVELLKRTGDAMMALSTEPQLKEWATAGKSLKGISNSTPEGDFTDRAAAAFEAMKAVFPELTPAPTIDEGAAVEAADEIVEEDPATGISPAGGTAGSGSGTGTGSGARPAAGTTTTPPSRTAPRNVRPRPDPNSPVDPDTAGAEY
jgi:hypothetical protein